MYSCTHELQQKQQNRISLHAVSRVTRIKKCSLCTNTKHTHPILRHLSCDCVMQAVTYHGVSADYITFVTLDLDRDTPTANVLLKTKDTNYSDTTHGSIKFTLLPNALTNSKPFPSKSCSNGCPFSSCKHRNIMDIRFFCQGAFTCIARKERNAA